MRSSTPRRPAVRFPTGPRRRRAPRRTRRPRRNRGSLRHRCPIWTAVAASKCSGHSWMVERVAHAGSLDVTWSSTNQPSPNHSTSPASSASSSSSGCVDLAERRGVGARREVDLQFGAGELGKLAQRRVLESHRSRRRADLAHHEGAGEPDGLGLGTEGRGGEAAGARPEAEVAADLEAAAAQHVRPNPVQIDPGRAHLSPAEYRRASRGRIATPPGPASRSGGGRTPRLRSARGKYRWPPGPAGRTGVC